MRTFTGAALSILLLSIGMPVEAQQPSADDLIEAYVEAIGGRDAFLGMSSVRMTGRIEMPGLGMRGDFELVQAPPDRMQMTMSLPGVGEVTTGFDGEIGWSDSPITGPMLMEGAELRQTAEMADVRAHLRDREVVPERETVGRDAFEGEGCWRVRLVWASGRESFDCYSERTGLLIASEDRQVTQMGELPVTTIYGNYQEVGSARFPTRMTQQTMGQEQVIAIDEMHADVVDPSELEAPASIRALLD